MKEMIVKVQGSNTYKRTYFNTVSCNGANLIAPWGMPGNSYKDVKVLEVISGGYTHGDGNHAWEAEYTLRISCPDNATLKIVGRQINGRSDYEILEEKFYA